MAYILSLYILFSALVPCSIFDKCEGSECTEQRSETDNHTDCNNCSPFSICSSVSGAIFHTTNLLVQPPDFLDSPTYSEYHFSSQLEYHSIFFQPPRQA